MKAGPRTPRPRLGTLFAAVAVLLVPIPALALASGPLVSFDEESAEVNVRHAKWTTWSFARTSPSARTIQVEILLSPDANGGPLHAVEFFLGPDGETFDTTLPRRQSSGTLEAGAYADAGRIGASVHATRVDPPASLELLTHAVANDSWTEFTYVIITNAPDASFRLVSADPGLSVTGVTAGADGFYVPVRDFRSIAAYAPGVRAVYGAEHEAQVAGQLVGAFQAEPDFTAAFATSAEWSGPSDRGAACNTLTGCAAYFPVAGPAGAYHFSVTHASAPVTSDDLWLLAANVVWP